MRRLLWPRNLRARHIRTASGRTEGSDPTRQIHWYQQSFTTRGEAFSSVLHRKFVPESRSCTRRSTNTSNQNGDGTVTRRSKTEARKEVRWDEYAEAYDVMCSANPAYTENLDIFNTWIGRLGLPRDAKVCDVGAGTGNYVLEVATRFPESSVIHLDSDPMMNRAASRKYRARGATTSDLQHRTHILPASPLHASI